MDSPAETSRMSSSRTSIEEGWFWARDQQGQTPGRGKKTWRGRNCREARGTEQRVCKAVPEGVRAGGRGQIQRKPWAGSQGPGSGQPCPILCQRQPQPCPLPQSRCKMTGLHQGAVPTPGCASETPGEIPGPRPRTIKRKAEGEALGVCIVPHSLGDSGA